MLPHPFVKIGLAYFLFLVVVDGPQNYDGTHQLEPTNHIRPTYLHAS
jgi:hypothetical protein